MTQSPGKRLGLEVIIFLGALFDAAVLLISQIAPNKTVELQPTADDPISARLLAEIDEYNRALQKPDPAEAMRSKLQCKCKTAQRHATQRALDLSQSVLFLN